MNTGILFILIIPPLITAIMLKIEITIISLAGAGAIAFFIRASESKAPPIFLWLGIGFVIIFALCLAHVFIYAYKSDRFKERIICYISEANILRYNEKYNNIYATSFEYINAVDNWQKKIATDIRKNKGKAEEAPFLDDSNIRLILETDNDTEREKRYHAAQKIGFWLLRLEELQRRL